MRRLHRFILKYTYPKTIIYQFSYNLSHTIFNILCLPINLGSTYKKIIQFNKTIRIFAP